VTAVSTSRQLVAEGIGTMTLLATVIGSGIMAERLAGGNVAVALLGNTIPTGAILYVLITIFGPVSGAHFNPAVTVAFAIRRQVAAPQALMFILMQIAGGLCGAMLAHLMFEMPILQLSQNARTGGAQWLSEFVATLGVCAGGRNRSRCLSVSISRRPTGLPPRQVSPIRR
jgi:glycerol uptake facilitator-like aquaporin